MEREKCFKVMILSILREKLIKYFEDYRVINYI